MSQTLKRKDDHVLSPSTKKARSNVVYRLATDVHRIQLESANLESRTDGSSSCAGPKYGSIKTLIEEAEKIYPWINRHTQARPDLCLTEYLADRGYEGEDVDRVLTCVTTEIMGTVQEGVVTMCKIV